MENKKLVKILRKDMSELEELISDVKSQGSFNPLEMDFIHTRAKGLMQLIQLIKVDEENGKVQAPLKSHRLEEIKETVSEIQETVSEAEKAEEKHSEVESKDTSEKQKPDEIKEDSDKKESETTESVAEEKEEIAPEQKEPEKVEEKETVTGEEKSAHDERDDDEMLEEEEADQSEANSRLGDSFLKGRSLNDLVTDQNKLEFKLSNRPVKSMKTAIGINDRFQYIRELFQGNADMFAETVNELDSKENLKQAVDYLRENFKWKKSETSLKFVNLVKRRFQNE